MELKHIATIKGEWVERDNEPDMVILLETGRIVKRHQIVGVYRAASPAQTANLIVTLLPQLKPNETTLIIVDDGDSGVVWFAVVNITRVSTAEDNS